MNSSARIAPRLSHRRSLRLFPALAAWVTSLLLVVPQTFAFQLLMIYVYNSAGHNITAGSTQTWNAPLGLASSVSFQVEAVDAPLQNVVVSLSGIHAADFQVTQSPSSTIAGRTSQTLTITHVGATYGQRTATVTIQSNALNVNPVTVNLSANVYAPQREILVQEPVGVSRSNYGGVTFPVRIAGMASALKTFTVRNTGDLPLNLSSVTLVGADTADFVLDTSSMISAVPAASSTAVRVTFTPQTPGMKEVTLRILSDDLDEATHDLLLRGEAATTTAPEFDLFGNGVEIFDGDISPSLADHTDFGGAAVNGSAIRTFTIHNVGMGPLNLTGPAGALVQLTGSTEYSVISQPSTVVPPLGSTTFQVRYRPTNTGTDIATVRIASDDAVENPYDFRITGRSLAPGEVDPSLVVTFSSSATIYGIVVQPDKKIILYVTPGTEGFYKKLGFLPLLTAMAIFQEREWAINRGHLSEA